MTNNKKTPEDEAYDNLIQELGLDLDLDLDVPIGDNAGAQDLQDLAVEESFEIEDREAGPQFEAEAEFDETGVELSAELVAELRSVIMGGEEPLDDQSSSEGADVFMQDGVISQSIPEPPPLAEDAFTLEMDAEAETDDSFNSTTDADVESAPLIESVEVEESAFGDLLAQLTSELDTSDHSDEDVDPAIVDAADIDVADPELDIATEQDIEEPGRFDPDFEEADIEDSDDVEGKFDLGFDAGVILGEVLEGRKSEEDASSFNLNELIEDADAPDELDEEAATQAIDTQDDDMSLADVLGRALDDALTEAEQEEPVESEVYLSKLDFDEEGEAGIDSHSPLDDVEERPLKVFEEEISTPSVEDLPPMPDPAGEEDEVVYSFNMAGDDVGDRLVPRISLHAFCLTAPVTQLLMAAQNDRRMANVSMEVHQGGSAAAFDYYSDRTTPHLLIVETTGNPAHILAELDQLAERCDENVKVIVVGAANDIRLYRELMHRGVSEYIVPPMAPVQLIRSVANLFVDPEQPFVGKTIAVTGVKGGVGASTIAHNLAWVMSERMESNTTLVDLDLNFGTTGLDFNEESQQTIADAILSPDRFDEAVLERLLTQATDNLSLFTAPATLDRTYDLNVETYEQVMSLVRQSVPFVVMDLPHIWSDWFKSAVVGADEIVVVAQPELASLRNGKNLIDFLKAARPNDAAPRLVINNVGVPRRPEIPVKDFAAALDIEPELVLPFDPQLFGTAANNGQMITEVAPESKCSQGLDYLAALLTGREPPQERQGSILNKFFKR